MVDGDDWHHYGFQVRIRGIDEPASYSKALAIHEAFATGIKWTNVVVGNNKYTIYAVSKQGGILRLGNDAPNTRRFLHTLNAFFACDQNLN